MHVYTLYTELNAAFCEHYGQYMPLHDLLNTTIVSMEGSYRLYRLEAKSEKGPRNHFRGDGMLEDVTHASLLV